MNIKWDAAKYTSDFSFVHQYGNSVIDLIDADKSSSVLYNALKENGQFVFEFGGYGNNQLIHKALAEGFSEHKYAYTMPFYFPTISEYSTLLENAGFRVVYAVLFDRMTELKGENGLKDWINMFVKTPFSAIGNEDEKETIIDKAVDNLKNTLYRDGIWYADYVRLRMKAIRL